MLHRLFAVDLGEVVIGMSLPPDSSRVLTFPQILEVGARLLVERTAERIADCGRVVHERDAVAQLFGAEKGLLLGLLSDENRSDAARFLFLAEGRRVEMNAPVCNFGFSLERRLVHPLPLDQVIARVRED